MLYYGINYLKKKQTIVVSAPDASAIGRGYFKLLPELMLCTDNNIQSMMAQSWSLRATYTRLVLYFAEYYEQFHNVVAEPVFQALVAAPVTETEQNTVLTVCIINDFAFLL